MSTTQAPHWSTRIIEPGKDWYHTVRAPITRMAEYRLDDVDVELVSRKFNNFPACYRGQVVPMFVPQRIEPGYQGPVKGHAFVVNRGFYVVVQPEYGTGVGQWCWSMPKRDKGR
jgi:hypothetical protein